MSSREDSEEDTSSTHKQFGLQRSVSSIKDNLPSSLLSTRRFTDFVETPALVSGLQSRLFDLMNSTSASYRQTDTLLGSSCDEDSTDGERDLGVVGRAGDEELNSPEFAQLGGLLSTVSEARKRRPATIEEGEPRMEEQSPQHPTTDSATRVDILSRGASSINCSTTASMSGRSTSSTISKPFRAYLLEDGASSKSSLTCSTRRPDSTDGSMGPRLLSLLGGDACSFEDEDSWGFSPLKTARESVSGKVSRRDSLGLGKAGVGATPLKFVETRNSSLGRLFRVTQKSMASRPGIISTCTRIEVIDTCTPEQATLFAVRHSDSNLWGRQMKVHKNILLAARLAGVEVSKDLDIPVDSKKVFEQSDNLPTMHTYLERIVPHIKVGHRARGVQLCWWRAIGNGAAVLLNRTTGKLILLKNYDKSIPAAIDCVCRMINSSKFESQAFQEPDPGYPTEEAIRGEFEDVADNLVDLENVDNLVARIWGSEELVSALTTSLVVRVQFTRFLRYSIGTDYRDPQMLLLQVHSNEPLSRGMNAYPVCTVQFPSPSLKLCDIRLTFKQAVWFLRKLHDVHNEAETTNTWNAQSASVHSDNSKVRDGSDFRRSPSDSSNYDDSSPTGEPPTPDFTKIDPPRPESSNFARLPSALRGQPVASNKARLHFQETTKRPSHERAKQDSREPVKARPLTSRTRRSDRPASPYVARDTEPKLATFNNQQSGRQTRRVSVAIKTAPTKKGSVERSVKTPLDGAALTPRLKSQPPGYPSRQPPSFACVGRHSPSRGAQRSSNTRTPGCDKRYGERSQDEFLKTVRTPVSSGESTCREFGRTTGRTSPPKVTTSGFTSRNHLAQDRSTARATTAKATPPGKTPTPARVAVHFRDRTGDRTRSHIGAGLARASRTTKDEGLATMHEADVSEVSS